MARARLCSSRTGLARFGPRAPVTRSGMNSFACPALGPALGPGGRAGVGRRWNGWRTPARRRFSHVLRGTLLYGVHAARPRCRATRCTGGGSDTLCTRCSSSSCSRGLLAVRRGPRPGARRAARVAAARGKPGQGAAPAALAGWVDWAELAAPAATRVGLLHARPPTSRAWCVTRCPSRPGAVAATGAVGSEPGRPRCGRRGRCHRRPPRLSGRPPAPTTPRGARPRPARLASGRGPRRPPAGAARWRGHVGEVAVAVADGGRQAPPMSSPSGAVIWRAVGRSGRGRLPGLPVARQHLPPDDGWNVTGPATAPQPAFDTRVVDGRVEARLR